MSSEFDNVGHATYFCVLSDAMLDRNKLRDDLKDRNFAYRYTQPFLLATTKKVNYINCVTNSVHKNVKQQYM